jgi:hypothetical protein
MAPDYQNYLLGQAITGAVINLLLNGAIGWLLDRQLPRVRLYGPHSIAGDVVGTSLLLPLPNCLTATPLIRGIQGEPCRRARGGDDTDRRNAGPGGRPTGLRGTLHRWTLRSLR